MESSLFSVEIAKEDTDIFHETEKICEKYYLYFFITLLELFWGFFWEYSFLQFFMPFVIGWIIAMIANPLVRILERRLKVAKKTHFDGNHYRSAGRRDNGDLFSGSKDRGRNPVLFLEQAPEMYSEFREEFQDAGKKSGEHC